MADTTSSPRAETSGKWLVQIVIPLITSVLVGIGSAAIMGSVLVVRLDERVSTLERDVARHEATIEKELRRMETTEASISKRTDEQERRIVLLESALERLREDVEEIKADVKSLLRSSVE